MSEEMNRGSIILYQTPDGQSKIEVTLSNDTVWLTADQMAELFQRNKSTISRHIRNIFEEGELNADSTVAFFATVQNEGTRKVERNIAQYSLLQSRHDNQCRLSCQFPSGRTVPHLGNTGATRISDKRICDE